MPKAIQVCEDNLDYIMFYAARLGFNLDYLRDNMEVNAACDEDTYLITDGTDKDRNVTFTEMTESGFRQIWKFVDHENPNHFVKIERV